MNMAQVTDGDTTNVRPFPGAGPESQPRPRRRRKDRTGAARQAKYRSKNKGDRYERPAADASPPPPTDAPPIAPTVTQSDVEDVTPTPHATAPRWRNAPASQRAAEHHPIDRLTLLAALALATVSAGFSIYGMTSIFVGAYWPVIGMGVALELGKLRAVTWIGRHGSSRAWGLKGALAVLVLVLMGLNVGGGFGFLAKAHIGHQVDGDVAVAGRGADIEARLSMQAGGVGHLDRRVAQIHKAIEGATPRGRTNAALKVPADH